MTPHRHALVLGARDLGVRELELPSLAPETVRVALSVAGICRTDLAVARGALAVSRPRVLGHEAAGQIVAVGPGVSPGRIGERVGIDPRTGPGHGHGFLGVSEDGAFASSIDLPKARAIALNPNVTPHRAAYLEPTAAALGAAIEMQRAHSPAIVGDNRIAALTAVLAAALGIDHRWYREVDDFDAAHDLIVESDARLIGAAVAALATGGTLILKSRPSAAAAVPVASVVRKGITLRGVAYGSFRHAAALLADPNIDFEALFGETFALGSFAQAFDHAETADAHKTFLRLEGR